MKSKNTRPLMTRAQRENWLYNQSHKDLLTFKWTSGGYGNRVRLQDKRGNTLAKCSGGGYDMAGTVLGDFIQDNFGRVVAKLDARDFYGLSHFCPRSRHYLNKAGKYSRLSIDGGTGWDSMCRILERVGFKLRKVYSDNKTDVYFLEIL